MDKKHYAQFDPPDLAPVLITEYTQQGWRGLTGDGEILNVIAHANGEPAAIPESISIARGGEIIGYRKVEQEISEGKIDTYRTSLDAANTALRVNDNMRALEEINVAMAYAPTMLARYNRAMILLTMGYWEQGFDEFAYCERNSDLFKRPQWRAAMDRGLQPWLGQNIEGRKLLLIHDHGFGDSIMMLRYVPTLQRMGAIVTLQVPPELDRLAAQLAPTTPELVDCDYVCSLLMLLQVLQVAAKDIPSEPYLTVKPALVKKWSDTVPVANRRIGIAWDVGKAVDGDYPRACPCSTFEKHLSGTLVSVQQTEHGSFKDFYDCAALMLALDEIVTVDTAAAHLAGAIGHPNVTLLLSHWHSWRWQAKLYENMQICVQDSAGDWDSAFSKRNVVL